MYSARDKLEKKTIIIFPNNKGSNETRARRERFFTREGKKRKIKTAHNNSNNNAPGSPGLPLAGADVRNPREKEEEEETVVVLLLANRRTIAVTAADIVCDDE